MTQHNPFARSDLVFFGAICRTISHEMNNVSAILQELVGLMQDRLAMASDERPLDTTRSAHTLERMEAQIHRATNLMGLLNRFGHSVDEFDDTLEAVDTVQQALELCRRFAELKKVRLVCHSDDAAGFSFQGSRFLLLHVLFRAIRDSLEHAPASSELQLTLAAADGGCRFELSGGGTVGGPEGETLAALVGACGGKMVQQTATTTIFWLPGELMFTSL